MTKPLSRWASSLAASALALGGVTFMAGGTVAQAAPGDSCQDPATVSVFEFNDFHGRIAGAAALFTPVENARAALGEDNVLLVSSGDNVGASTFESFINKDNPTIDILKAAKVDAIGAGNHEFDTGFTDLSERIIPRMGVPHLSANVYTKGTTTVAAPLKEYEVFTKAGVRIAVVGAVTGDLPSLVSPAGIAEIEAGDPVEAVNRVAKKIVAENKADIIIAAFHEGAPDPSKTAAENAAMSPAFKDIYEGLDDSFDVVFNGHTHQIYDWKTTKDKPLMQAGSYAGQLSKVDLKVDSVAKKLCSSSTAIVPAAKNAIGTQPRILEIQAIAAQAKVTSDVLGAEPVGFANQAISTPDGTSSVRNVESPMGNLVAQMFKEQLQTDENADSFIGIQNGGGTRDSVDRGTITFKEAANVLPFANTLMTTQLTGKQFKMVLEQQYQLDKDGNVPGRAYQALGISDNVSYTFDESRERLDRITSISIDGEPIKMDKLYTLGSGSFLIAGGDNFFAFMDGVNTVDSGRADLEAFVDWVKNSDALNPDYSKRGVSAPTVVGTLTEGAAPVEYVFGKPLADGVQVDTLDMQLTTGIKVSPQLKNANISAWIGDEMVGMGTVTEGVGTVKVAIAKGTPLTAGNHAIDFWVEESDTWINLPVSVKLLPEVTPEPEKPVNIYTTPGYHKANGREWITSCEKYSVTERCTTYIHGTQVEYLNGMFVKRNGWTFNNLTYKPSDRNVWKGNKLGYTNEWTSTDGRNWKTECDTPVTGRNGCRSYIESKVVQATKKTDGTYSYALVTKFVFNNIVLFK